MKSAVRQRGGRLPGERFPALRAGRPAGGSRSGTALLRRRPLCHRPGSSRSRVRRCQLRGHARSAPHASLESGFSSIDERDEGSGTSQTAVNQKARRAARQRLLPQTGTHNRLPRARWPRLVTNLIGIRRTRTRPSAIRVIASAIVFGRALVGLLCAPGRGRTTLGRRGRKSPRPRCARRRPGDEWADGND